MRNFFVWAVLGLSCASLLQAQGSSSLRLERLGAGTVSRLPPPSPKSQHARSSPVLVDDPELFQGQKMQAQNGGSGFPAAVIHETPSTLAVNTGFPGLTLADTPGYVPPDTQVAAGINANALTLVEMVNGTVRVYDGTGATINTVDMCSFFFCDFFTAVISDPIVRFDAASGRWFASIVTIEYVAQGALLVPEGQWRLAVSQSSDPNGT